LARSGRRGITIPDKLLALADEVIECEGMTMGARIDTSASAHHSFAGTVRK
jgi:hypothetical protein